MTANGEAEAIERTVLDYFEGWFEGDAERMRRALHPELVKRRGGDALGVTTQERMLELTEQGEGKEDAGDGRVDVTICDIHENIACATVRTAVYREYVHLVRTADGWRIANALWQLA
jgi:Putative lumazine-binding